MTTADIRITANASQANRELEGFAARVTSVAGIVRGSMGGIGSAVMGLQGRLLALTGIVSGGFLAAGVKAQIDMMDALDETSQKAGVTVQALAELSFVATMGGLSQEAMVKVLAKLSDMMVKVAGGDEPLRKLFRDTLQVDVRDATGAMRTADDMLAELANRFAGMEDGPRKTALAIQLFGEKLGPQLLPMLNQGRAGISELREEFRALHGVVSTENAAAAAQFNDNLDRLGIAANGLKQQIGNAVLPALVDISTFAVKAAKDVGILEAAWLSFGRVVARVTGNDEAALARRDLAAATGHTKALEREIANLERHAERQPANAGLKQQLDEYKARLAEVKARADAARQAVARLAEEAKAPTATPAKSAGTDPIPPYEAPKGDTRMQEWEAGLARRRAAFAKNEAELGGLRELGKEAEAEYWRKILDSLGKGDAQRTAVELKYYGLQADLRKQRFEGEQASLQAQIDAQRGHMDAQAALSAEYVERARQRFGEESREYQTALKAQQALLRSHAEARLQIEQLYRQTQAAARLAEVDDFERIAQLQYQVGAITAQRLLQLRGQAIEQRRQIEESAKAAEIEAMRGNPNADPVALERLQAELAAIRLRYKGLAAANQGEQGALKESAQMEPFNAIFGVSQSAVEQGLQSMVMNMTVTLEGLRNVFRQIGGVMVQELITKPLATWIVGQARMVALTWAFGQQKATAEATTAAQITAIQAAASLKVIAMKAYEAAAGAYSAIAGIPYVGPILAPIAAGVALAGVFAFAKSIFSAEGGFDIPKGVNPIVQTHANEMILPSKHADTIRTLGDMFQGGQGMPMGGSIHVQVEGHRLDSGHLILTEDNLIKALKKAHRNYRV